MVDVIVYSKPGCCLCEEVKAQLRRLQIALPFEWSEVNILDDPQAFAAYNEEIPVITIRGKKAFQYHLDEEKFLNLLGA